MLRRPLAQAQEAAVAPGKVSLASEAWDDYTNADGSGLAWDLLRQVFEPAGFKLQTRSVPYTRSVGLAQRGEVDGWVGSYPGEVKGVVYPHWRYDSDHIYALGLATTPTPTLTTLANYRLAWVRGYKFEAYLPNVQRFNQIERRDGILPMLQHGRADFISTPSPSPNSYSARRKTPHSLSSPLSLSCRSTSGLPTASEGGCWRACSTSVWTR